MAASTVPAAKQALLDLLLARPALNEVRVEWSEPTEVEDLEWEAIYFDGPVRRTPEWATIGGPNSPLRETYVITLHVRNYTLGDDRQVAEERCWELIAEIESALREDPANLRLDGLLFKPLEFDEQDVRSFPESNKFSVSGLVPLICTANI